MRRDLERLIEQLATLGVDLTLTTNGSLLPQKAQALADAGLHARHRQPRLARRRDVPRAERRRLPGRPRARGHRRRRAPPGLPVKVNAVVKRGVERGSDRPDGARSSASAGTRCASSSTWTSGTRTAGASTTSSRRRRSSRRSTARSASSRSTPTYRGEVAQRYRYRDGAGEIGVIASVTQPFCGDCTRARLSAEGRLYTCLFAVRGHDLRARDPRAARRTTSSPRPSAAVWRVRGDRYSELRSAATATCRRSR